MPEDEDYYEAEIELGDLLRPLIRHWVLIIFVTLVSAGIALGYSKMQTPTYQTSADLTAAKTTVNIKFAEKIETLSQEKLEAVSGESRMKALLGLVRNGTIANTVYEELKGELPESFKGPRSLINKVSAQRQGDLIKIKVSGKEPELLSKIANSWAREYENQVNEIYGSTTREETGQIVMKAMKKAKTDYQEAQKNLKNSWLITRSAK